LRLVRLKVELNEKNFLDRDRKQLNESEPKAKLEFSARSFFEINETEGRI